MEQPGQHAVCVTGDELERLADVAAGEDFFWLDLHSPTDAVMAQVGETLDLHPLSIEDSQHFGQRPKFETYRDHVFIVFFGAAPSGDEDRLTEVHMYFTERFLVTVHRDESAELTQLEKRVRRNALTGHLLLHALLDALVDSFASVIDESDAEIDEIETRILHGQLTDSQNEIFAERRRLVLIGRTLHRQSDTFGSLMDGVARVPGYDPESAPYFRDVRDHLWRMSEAADTLRDRTAGVTEIYLAAASNRMNVVMKQFTVIAGIFLPMSVVVGFFGMNFDWMVEQIDSAWAFWLLGVVAPVAVIALLLLWFVQRGWLRQD